jgi:DNA polymerase III gamma/tau subunit
LEEEKLSISIDQVHELLKDINLKPFFENHKVAIIYPAHLLTLPAQQALLKTLEEPPENTQIILATSLPGKLLPTILSRLTNQASTLETIEAPSPLYENLKKLKISECIKTSDTWSKDRAVATKNLRELIGEIRNLYLVQATQKLLSDEKAAIICLEQLERNVNIKLALDHLFFTISNAQVAAKSV